MLNLSHNNLSGSIPPSLGNLQVLEQLDLSFNNLKGEVPTKGIFKNNATSVLINGNQGLCGGPLELHLLPCPVMHLDSSKHKLSILLKVVIPLVIVLLLVVIISVLSFRRGENRKQRIFLYPLLGESSPKFLIVTLPEQQRALQPPI